MGYEVETLKTYAEEYPEQPVAPEKADYDTAEQYEQAYTEYERASADYTEECEMIREPGRRRRNGVLSPYRQRRYYPVLS